MANKQNPVVSIVILNYNGKQFLNRCLNSIFNQSFSRFELIFVDNASNDGSVNYIERLFGNDPRLKIIENEANYGPIEGNNIGIRHSNRQTKYVLLLNNDTELIENWLFCMINALESDPKIGAAASKQLLMDDPERLQGFGSFIDICGFNYQLGEFEIDNNQYNGKIIEIFAGGTTALFLRTSVLRQIGLLDSNYEHGFDDIDLCWRVWLSGHKVVCVSSCKIYHKVAGTTRKVNLARVVYHREKNRIMTAVKNYTNRYIIRVLPIILTFDLLQLSWFVFTNNFLMFQSIGQALIWDIKHFKYMWAQHLRVKYQVRRVSDEEIVRRMLKTNLIELWRRIGSLS